jgi:adhesin transport system outer membrane protein
MMRGILILIFAVLVLFPAPSDAITLDEAVTMALDVSEASRSAGHQAEALRADARTRTAFALPQVGLGGTYLRMDTNAAESPFVQFPEENLSGRIEASQLLWAGGRILNSYKLKASLVENAFLTEQALRRDVRKGVRLAFYSVLYRKALLGILCDRVAQREEELQDARDLRAAGMVTSLDVRQAKLLLNSALDELKVEDANYEQSLIDFNLGLGRSGGGELLLPEGQLMRVPELLVFIEAAKAALSEEKLLDVRAAESELSAWEYEKKITTGEYLPELSLVGTAESVKEGIFQEGESWTAGVQLRWSLLDGGLRRAKRAASAARLEIAEENLSLTNKRLAGLVRSLQIRASSLAERISLQREALKLSEENYADARGHYRAGTITQTRLGEFNLSYAEARFGLKSLYFLELQLLTELQALLEGT